jgi:acyl-CoA synthetase (NDP forming)
MEMVSGGRRAIDCALRPRSVAVIGVSQAPGSAGQNAIRNLLASGYSGELHVVARGGGEFEGVASVPTIADLPAGVDLAVLALPAGAVLDAVRECGTRGIGVAVIFASGFGELGAEGRAAQDALADAARAADMALIGPNCLGYSSKASGISISFGVAGGAPAPLPEGPAIAVLAQSGGMMANAGLALGARQIPIAHSISTGNEAVLGIEDFLADIARDTVSNAVIVYAEQVRRPEAFVAAIRDCTAHGKTVVMLHPGRSERAQEAAFSHSGAMASDHLAMQVLVTQAGAIFVETLEELVDVAELMARYGRAPTKGVGVLTFSGAVCGIALDYCDRIGLDVPRLEPATIEGLVKVMPPFAQPANPLDLTTQPQREPELSGKGLQALLDDPNIGSVVIAITPGGPQQSLKYFDGLQPALGNATKPVALAIMGDGSPLIDDFMARVRAGKFVFLRSPERALRAMAALTRHGQTLARAGRADPVAESSTQVGKADQGVAEHRAKAFVASLGIATPAAALATNVAEAIEVADRIGYPVALKAQAGSLQHKTDAGGVALNVTDRFALIRTWNEIVAAVAHAAPGIALDGMLVERMADPGLDLIVSARRVPGWGVVTLVGVGGIWTEALKDFRLVPAGLAEPDIVDELGALRAAPLLHGIRGAPPVDRAAIAAIVRTIGLAVANDPTIGEIEINPLRVFRKGAIALDAVMQVTEGWAT